MYRRTPTKEYNSSSSNSRSSHTVRNLAWINRPITHRASLAVHAVDNQLQTNSVRLTTTLIAQQWAQQWAQRLTCGQSVGRSIWFDAAE
jgi:hypothetical protein